MGLFSWLFPTPEHHLARAQRLMAQERWADAKMAAEDAGDLAGAAEVISQAERALCLANLDQALFWARSGDAERVNHHLEMAGTFHHGDMQDAFDDTRAQIQEIIHDHRAASADAQQNAAARSAEIDPRFKRVHPEDALMEGRDLDEDAAADLRARIALVLESYPEDLQEGMIDLGASFADAVLALEEGRADDALPVLVGLPDDAPLVQHERARAAMTLGDPASAAKAWRRFAELADGHRPMGGGHTAAYLANAEALAGDASSALATLEAARAEAPDLATGLYASLLAATGDLRGAEAAWRTLIDKHGAKPELAVQLAHTRLLAGHRGGAKQALEASLQETVCEPGRCGYRPPDLALHRLLATLYLEDGDDVARGLELADTAAGLVDEPAWEDAYLATLTARASADDRYDEVRARLEEITPDEPRFQQRLDTYLPA